MDNQSPEQHERLWRQTLSAAERAKLEATPELELEARLTDALVKLPAAAVPSNFTARVLAAVDLEDTRAERLARSSGWHWNWRAFLPRMAVTAAILVVAGVGYQRYETGTQRAEMAQSLSMIASAKAVPDVEALKNLEAIQRMSESAHADTELLADLQ